MVAILVLFFIVIFFFYFFKYLKIVFSVFFSIFYFSLSWPFLIIYFLSGYLIVVLLFFFLIPTKRVYLFLLNQSFLVYLSKYYWDKYIRFFIFLKRKKRTVFIEDKFSFRFRKERAPLNEVVKRLKYRPRRRRKYREFYFRNNFAFSFSPLRRFFFLVLFWESGYSNINRLFYRPPYFFYKFKRPFRFRRFFVKKSPGVVDFLYNSHSLFKYDSYNPQLTFCFVLLNRNKKFFDILETIRNKHLKAQRKFGAIFYSDLFEGKDHKKAAFVRLRLNSDSPINSFPLIS